MQPGRLTSIQAVQTRGRWRWWALAAVVVLVVAALVGAVVAIAEASDDASALAGVLQPLAAVLGVA